MNNKTLTIRIAAPEDAAALLAIYKPYVEHTAITFEYDVPTEAEFRSRIEHTLVQYPYIVAELDGQPVGYAYASGFKERVAYSWSVETSIYVAEDCRRGGVGRALYDELERMLGGMGILNLNACIAYPVTEDEYLDRNSVDFHAHLGYRLVGEFYQCGYKFDRWYNMVWMEKMIGDHIEGQPSVIPFSQWRKMN